jgi:transcription-repair coupling factor (superfamily II helicase)
MLTPGEFFYNLNRRCCVGMALMNVSPEHFEITAHYSVDARSVSGYNNQFPMLVRDLKKWKQNGYTVVLLSASHTRAKRLAGELLDEGLTAFYSEDEERTLLPGEIMVMYGNVRKGFEYPMQRFVLITETDIFGRVRKKRKPKKKTGANMIHSLEELSAGDYVIHEGHGLGIYRGIRENGDRSGRSGISSGSSMPAGAVFTCRRRSLIFSEIRERGRGKRRPKINKLGGQEWNRTKRRVRGAVRDIAKDLVRLYAVREKSLQGYQYGPDTVWQREFEELFPYEETEDQLQAIEDTKRDMESGKIMDRLICGDVGFGKTEVALRAAFKAVQEGKQVVLPGRRRRSSLSSITIPSFSG